jgi:deoxyribodipyrimidine photo-lyase
MRALHKEGWINFRMRAMLVSFASYQLWLHWRQTGIHLARLFVDFEPGIHLSQLQMQSGVTGINTLRIYSPIKQSHDQDPEGNFIREHCPELAELPTRYIHEPWTLPPLLGKAYGFDLGRTYPAPIVDPKESYQQAKKQAFHWWSKPEVRRLAKAVLRKHGSRKNQFFPSQNRQPFRKNAPVSQ